MVDVVGVVDVDLFFVVAVAVVGLVFFFSPPKLSAASSFSRFLATRFLRRRSWASFSLRAFSAAADKMAAFSCCSNRMRRKSSCFSASLLNRTSVVAEEEDDDDDDDAAAADEEEF